MSRKIIEIKCSIFKVADNPTYHAQVNYTKKNYFLFVSLYKGEYPRNGDKIICLINHSKSEKRGHLIVLKHLNKIPITRHVFLLLRHL
jgi:hypothetical protein